MCLLRHDANDITKRSKRDLSYIVTVNENRSPSDVPEARDQIQDAALPRSRGSHQCRQTPWFRAERDLVQRKLIVARRCRAIRWTRIAKRHTAKLNAAAYARPLQGDRVRGILDFGSEIEVGEDSLKECEAPANFNLQAKE